MNDLSPKPLSVAFIAPHAVPDISSGASLWVHTALRALAERGVRCSLITTTTFDAPVEINQAQWLQQWFARHAFQVAGPRLGKGDAPPIQVWKSESQGIQSWTLQTTSCRRESLRALDEAFFADLVDKLVEQQQPDIVLSYGGMLLDEALRRRLKRRGCKLVFFLANGNYRQQSTFEDVDAFITDSQATSNLYRQRFGITATNVGNFVDTRLYRDAPRDPLYCTLINPAAQKGVSVFLRLVEMAAERAPDMRFLTVESRSTLVSAIDRLGLDKALLQRVDRLSAQADLRAVYEKTRVLLMPSLVYESSGRVAIEALTQGIPVLSTGIGGIAETLGDGGILLDVPERCHRDPWQMPRAEELEAWWQNLYSLWSDAVHYVAATQRALTAAQAHVTDSKAERLQLWLSELRSSSQTSSAAD